MTPAAAKPSVMPSERPVTSRPLARTRWSRPTMSGTQLRSATFDSVEAAPETTASAYSSATWPPGETTSTSRPAAWATSPATIRARRR
jgi:hypothetical protein